MIDENGSYDIVFAACLLKFLRKLLAKSSREKHMIKSRRSEEDAVTLLIQLALTVL